MRKAVRRRSDNVKHALMSPALTLLCTDGLSCAGIKNRQKKNPRRRKEKRINVLKQTSHYCEAGTVRVAVTYFRWSHKYVRTLDFLQAVALDVCGVQTRTRALNG